MDACLPAGRNFAMVIQQHYSRIKGLMEGNCFDFPLYFS